MGERYVNMPAETFNDFYMYLLNESSNGNVEKAEGFALKKKEEYLFEKQKDSTFEKTEMVVEPEPDEDEDVGEYVSEEEAEKDGTGELEEGEG